MKKILSIILMLVMLAFLPHGFAENTSEQFANLSTTDLCKLYLDVEKELVSRGESENLKLIPGGRYVVGKNLPAGTYELILYKGIWGMGEIFIYASLDDYKSSEVLDQIEMLSTGAKARVDLEEGNILFIDSLYTFLIKKVDSKIFSF